MTKVLVSGDHWSIALPLLPAEPSKPKGGRPPVGDPSSAHRHSFRAALGNPVGNAAAADEMQRGRDMLEAAARLQEARVWDKLHQELLQRLQWAERIDWSRAGSGTARLWWQKGRRGH
jgi:hypothetical protein